MHHSFGQRQSICESAAVFWSATAAPVVLDTNVAFDLLVFRDPASAPLAARLASGQWRWVATAPMRTEFELVVARPEFERWAPQPEAIAAFWATWVSMIEAPAASSHGLHCADSADQMFLDLALALQPCRLFSRDRELLRLARRALPLGVTIAAPAPCIPDNETAKEKAATRAALGA